MLFRYAINHTIALHYFQGDDTGSHLGNEVATKKLSENITLLGKLAYLDGSSAQADIFRASVQLDYAF